MQLKKIPLADTHAFTPFFLDYLDQNDNLKSFYNRFPQIDNFKEQISDKSKNFTAHHRQVLVSTLTKQYQQIQQTDTVKQNISSLAEHKTFTITTGHQLNIFTGPLY